MLDGRADVDIVKKKMIYNPPLQAILREGYIKDLVQTCLLNFQAKAEAVFRTGKTGD